MLGLLLCTWWPRLSSGFLCWYWGRFVAIGLIMMLGVLLDLLKNRWIERVFFNFIVWLLYCLWSVGLRLIFFIVNHWDHHIVLWMVGLDGWLPCPSKHSFVREYQRFWRGIRNTYTLTFEDFYFMGFARVPSINLSKSLKFQEFYSLFTLVGSSNPLFSTTFIMSCLCLFVTFGL